MSFETVFEAIKNKVGTDCGLASKVKFSLDEGKHTIFVDATVVPNVVSTTDAPADCTVRASTETIAKIISGDSNAMTAFMMGKIKVDNMAIAMNITKIL